MMSLLRLISVFQGDRLVNELKWPDCRRHMHNWTVLTLDVSFGRNTLHLGDMDYSPNIPASDASVSSGLTAVTGVEMYFFGNLEFPRRKEYPTLKSSALTGITSSSCQTVSWRNAIVQETWAVCPSGSFLKGLNLGMEPYANNTGLVVVESAECCTYGNSLGERRYGTCHNQAFNAEQSVNRCQPLESGDGTAIVGMQAKLGPPYRGNVVGRSAASATGVFIGGDYIELGFRTNNNIGRMGTDDCPSDFTCRQNGQTGVGMIGNNFGWSAKPAATLDYFMPNSPEENFYLGYKSQDGSTKKKCKNCGSSVRDSSIETAPLASATIIATLGDLQVTQVITLGKTDKFFKNTITVKNMGENTMSSVRFMRSNDADNTADANGFFKTKNTIEDTINEGGEAIVSAESLEFDQYYTTFGETAKILYYSTDARAKVSFGSSTLAPNSVYQALVYDNARQKGKSREKDVFISICFDIAELAPKQEETMSYYTMLASGQTNLLIDSLRSVSKPHLSFNELQCCSLQYELPPGEQTCPV